MAQMDTYQKLILNILMNYINYTMIILQLQKNLKLVIICCKINLVVLQIEYVIKIPPTVNKSVPNLGNKYKFVLHYENIQLYLS